MKLHIPKTIRRKVLRQGKSLKVTHNEETLQFGKDLCDLAMEMLKIDIARPPK